MAIRVRKEDLRIILMQAMFAAKSIRGQRDRLLHHQQVQLQRIPGAAPEDRARMLEEAISGLEAVCNDGIKAAALYLTVCLDKAAKNGARLAPRPSSSRQLMDALAAALPLPERPTTQAEAFSRIEAALWAVRLPQEHPLPLCIDLLRKISPTAPATGSMMDKARAHVDRACKLLNIAIEQVDLAVAVISGFRHPKEVASNARFAERYTSFGWSGEDWKFKRMLEKFGVIDSGSHGVRDSVLVNIEETRITFSLTRSATSGGHG